MITLQEDKFSLQLMAESYQLSFRKDRPFVYVETLDGEVLAELFPFSSVHPLNGRDDTYQTGTWTAHGIPDANCVELSITAKSSTWDSKTYRFCCYPHRFTYSIELEGEGQIADALYFGGYYSESLRWSSGFFWSGQHFAQVFNPEPNMPEVFHHQAAASSKIDLMGVPIPAKGDWFFTPPPFCFAAQLADQGWLGFGVEAAAGKNTFTEYHYHGTLGAFYLSLSYEGHTRVNGHYQLPAIGFDFAADEYAALGQHVSALRAAGYTPIPPAKPTPIWWRTPIFCGWGAQSHLAKLESGHAPDHARQENYEGFLDALEYHNLNPGVVVLDDKWQTTYGGNQVDEAKWYNICEFIERQHQKNRKVLLWYKAWDCEGVPLEECITNAGGNPITVDPTHPAFEQRLRESVQQMLSSSGYNADGFKIDFTARIPSGYGLRIHREIWGLELMRHYLSILYSEAKRIKPDALIMTHTPHPYLADVLDMIRLNDINTGRDVNRAMTHRAKVAAQACPEAIIDTDNWPITDKATWRQYMEIQADLGVPSLYYATHIDKTLEPLTEDDYALIRHVWEQAKVKSA